MLFSKTLSAYHRLDLICILYDIINSISQFIRSTCKATTAGHFPANCFHRVGPHFPRRSYGIGRVCEKKYTNKNACTTVEL